MVEGHQDLGAASGGDDTASAPIGGVRAPLDQPGRFEVVEEIGHDCAIDTEMLGQGELAANRAVSGGGEDLVAPRTARDIGHGGMRGLDVCPEDHAQAPSEIFRQGVLGVGAFPRVVVVLLDIAHHLIIRARRRKRCRQDDLLT
ncbi:MAG: hypothetical protein JWM18_4299 [Chloroflexi bacterium]|nr:hypothetical protein [Chloroflexota bacterium]